MRCARIAEHERVSNRPRLTSRSKHSGTYRSIAGRPCRRDAGSGAGGLDAHYAQHRRLDRRFG